LPNVYTSLENCQADAPDLGRTDADCREFTETESRGGDTFAISDPGTNDLMAANGEPQGADVRRIQWMYDLCDEGDCGGGPRCEIGIGIPSCVLTSNLTLGRPARRASLPLDPTAEEIPEFALPILERGLAIDVQFDTATDATLVATYVTATDSPADVGNPPLMQVDCLDADGTLLYEFTDWHPLWMHEEGESGDEELVILESAEKTFIAPFHPLLDAIRITDIELDVEVLLADVGDVVRDFCTTNSMEPTCQLPTTTTTMPTGGVCGDPLDPGALVAGPRAVTATDALFALQAAVGLISCELCVCDVNNSTAITASDALAILAAAVGQAITLTCPDCSG
jgi:hypothetical protein